MIMSLSRRLAAWLRPLAKECIAGAAVAGAAAGAVCAVVLHRRLTATRAALDAIEERLAAHSTGLDFLAQELEALRLALRQPQLAGSSNSSVSGRPVRSVGGGSRTASMATAEDEGLSEAGWSDAGWSEAGGYRTADEEDLDDLLLSAPAPFSHKPPPPLHGAERAAADSDADADGASAATPPRGGASAAEEEGASSAAASAAAPSSALAARVQEAATLVVRADEAYAARETGLARSLLEEASALGLPDAARAEVRWRLARTLKELADEEKAAGQAGGSDGARKARPRAAREGDEITRGGARGAREEPREAEGRPRGAEGRPRGAEGSREHPRAPESTREHPRVPESTREQAAKQREKSLMLESLGAAREAVDLDGDQFGARKWVRDRRGLSFAVWSSGFAQARTSGTRSRSPSLRRTTAREQAVELSLATSGCCYEDGVVCTIGVRAAIEQSFTARDCARFSRERPEITHRASFEGRSGGGRGEVTRGGRGGAEREPRGAERLSRGAERSRA